MKKQGNSCFTHTSINAAGTCNYCKAEYCSDCLNRIGEDDELICDNCHGTLTNRFYQSMMNRKRLIYVGYIVMAVSFFIVTMKFGESASYLAMILFLFVGGLIWLTKKRVDEMKGFLKARPF